MTSRVIFIDVDGPLIPARALFLPENRVPAPWTFDPCAVGMLNFLFWALPDLRAVISSHRVGCATPPGFEGLLTFDRAFWENIFAHNKLRATLHEHWITPRRITARPKIVEVSEWLARHPEVKQFAVIEDEFNGHDEMTDELQQQFNVFAEDYSNGITYECFLSAARALGLSSIEVRMKFREFSLLAPQ